MNLLTSKEIEDIVENPSPMHALMLCADFRLFIQLSHFAINRVHFQFKDFHITIISELTAIANCENEKRNLALCLPVGCGKSLIVEYFIAWTFCRNINLAYVYCSHSSTNILKLSREVRDMFTHPFFQAVFGLQLKIDEASKTNWSFAGAINRTGLLATTTAAGSTGADSGNPGIIGYSGAVVIDDPIDASDSESDIVLTDAAKFYDEKLATRRRTPKTPTILLMQRLSVDDLVGWVEKNEPDLWKIIVVPALNEDGSSFWPERYPLEELLRIRRSNPKKFYSQYQQTPLKDTGRKIFDITKFKKFSEFPVFDRIVSSWDTALKEKLINDPSACGIFGIKRNKVGIEEYYLIYVWKDRVLYPKLKGKYKEVTSLYNCNTNLIEDKASGQSLIPDLRNEGHSNIVAIDPGTKDKVERAQHPSEIVEQGRFYVLEGASWLREYEDELAVFPDKKMHDDQVDFTTQFLNWAAKPQGNLMGF